MASKFYQEYQASSAHNRTFESSFEDVLEEHPYIPELIRRLEFQVVCHPCPSRTSACVNRRATFRSVSSRFLISCFNVRRILSVRKTTLEHDHVHTHNHVCKHNQVAFHTYTQMHTDDLCEAVLRLVVHELFITVATTGVVWTYMTQRCGSTLHSSWRYECVFSVLLCFVPFLFNKHTNPRK